MIERLCIVRKYNESRTYNLTIKTSLKFEEKNKNEKTSPPQLHRSFLFVGKSLPLRLRP